MTKKVLDTYIDAATKHGEATEAGDHRKANRQYARLIAAYKEMLKSNDHVFETLLAHPNSSVRAWAAVHTLPFNPDGARKVLADIAEGRGLVAFGAQITLEEFDKGSLRIDGYHINQD